MDKGTWSNVKKVKVASFLFLEVTWMAGVAAVIKTRDG